MQSLTATMFSLARSVELIESEGWENKVYPDSEGYLTIGGGHKLTRSELTSGNIRIEGVKRRWRDGLSNFDVLRLLHQDIALREGVILQRVTVPLNQNQFDALLMFIYNIGRTAFLDSTLLRLLNQGQYEEVPAQMQRWIYAGGEIVEGLKARRAREAELWERTPDG